MRQAERKYQESEKEAATLRNKLLLLETNLSNANQKLIEKTNNSEYFNFCLEVLGLTVYLSLVHLHSTIRFGVDFYVLRGTNFNFAEKFRVNPGLWIYTLLHEIL